MKKKSLLIIFALAAITVSAQQQEGASAQAGRNTTFVNNGFWDNWFFGAGAGANMYFGDKDVDARLRDRVTVTPNIQVGKWFNPYSGARLKVSGGTNIHTFNKNASVMTRNRYIATELNYMWNMTDYLMSYSADRLYSFIPYVGAGWAYGWDYKNTPADINNEGHVHSVTFDAGVINRFKFTNRVALDLELSGKLLKDKFDQRAGGKRGYDLLGTASANLVVSIGKNIQFSEAVLRNQSEIDELNGTINKQRADIASLAKRPVDVPEPTVVVKEVIKEVKINEEPVNNVVLFGLNQVKVASHQEVNVYNVAKFLKENADKKVRITGYTDKETGTAAINEKLSRQRSQSVADIITGKYGIAKERVIVEWEGQTNPPFDVKEWNRAVILYIE